MLHVTFDTNLLIDLEESREGFEKVREIVDLHNSGKLKICIPAIIGSEKILDAKLIPNYGLFEKYLKTLNIIYYEELMPLMYFGIGFLNHGLFTGPELTALDHQIHKILFPNIELEYADFCKSKKIVISESEKIHGKWRNAKIDVQVLWCHIHYKKDIFITRDMNFKKHLNELNEQIGQIKILNPSEFLELFKELVD